MEFHSMVTVEITSADIPRMLREFGELDIPLYDIRYVSDISVTLRIKANDFSAVSDAVRKSGCTLKILGRRGMLRLFGSVVRRPVLLVTMIILIFASCVLPMRILFVEVEGNDEIPARLILEKAEECGIRFGASRRKVRSEQMKNSLLAAIPELQWAGINTAGCVATISVEEKSTVTDTEPDSGQVCSIVAAQDGIITNCIVRSGNPLCRVGQAVTTGQILVSGYTDCGITVQATRAEAEITANTLRYLDAAVPSEYFGRGEKTHESVRYSLLIGKKLINFFKDSGISDSTCVKMYSKKYLTLPGGRTLPVALITERHVYYQTDPCQLDLAAAGSLLETASRDYLVGQMVAGEILDAVTHIQQSEDLYLLTGQYVCSEMIGQVIYEERIYSNGEND